MATELILSETESRNGLEFIRELNAIFGSVFILHQGESRPADLPEKGLWLKFLSGSNELQLLYFTGTEDILLLTVDLTTKVASVQTATSAALAVDVADKVDGDGVSDIVALSQTEYDAIATKDAETLYLIT